MKLHIWFNSKQAANYYIAILPEFKNKIGKNDSLVHFSDDRYCALIHISHTGDLGYDIEHSFIKILGIDDDTKTEEYKIMLSDVSFIGELK